ncbi:MAG TPA: cyclic nucleotide-binding domain-containing protein [Gaiellaceae bacterium]
MDPSALRALPLFARLTGRDLAQLGRWADEIDVAAGAKLTREGGLAQEFFVIVDGTAEVTSGGEVIRLLGPGDFFGEIGLLETVMRTATVTATTPLRAIVVFGREFRELERTQPDVAAAVRRTVEERLSDDEHR